MPANKMTLKAVDAILQADLGVSSIVRGNVIEALGREAETQCGEKEAARILDISATTLFLWRKGDWTKAPHPFWFSIWFNPAGEVRYDIAQLRSYSALRRSIAGRNNPQPNITADDVARFNQVIGEH